MNVKLKHVLFRGFKALRRLDLRFPGQMLVLVGSNGAGKSSILQATAFIQYMAKGQPERFFEDRGWTVGDVRCRVEGPKKYIGYNVHLELDGFGEVAWGVNWSPTTKLLEAESIWYKKSNDETPLKILSYSRVNRSVSFGNKKIEGIRSTGSVLSFIDIKSLDNDHSFVIEAVKSWANGIFSLELLSPVAMRRGNRGANTDIGPRGERLGGFLAALSPEKKERLIARMAAFYPVDDIETTKKKAGWIDLKIAENYAGLGKISASHMSDGFMRLLGIASIPEFGSEASLVLLDEIEDGVEPHILADFIELISGEASAQILMTSHSPILVNRFNPADVCFISRAKDGSTIAAGFDEIEEMKTGLEFFGAGEIWSQTSMVRIAELVKQVSEKNNAEHDILLSKSSSQVERVTAFLGS